MFKISRGFPALKGWAGAPRSTATALIQQQQHGQSSLDDDSKNKTAAARGYATIVPSPGLPSLFPPPRARPSGSGAPKTTTWTHSGAGALLAAFRGALARRNVFEAWAVYEQARTRNLLDAFEAGDFNAILRILRTKSVATRRSDKIALMEGVMDDMRRMGVAPDAVTFVTMMAAYSKRGDVASVQQCLLAMAAQGLRADSQDNVLLDAYVHSGDWAGAAACFAQLRASRSPQLLSAYNIMMQAASSATNGHAAVLEYLVQLQNDALEPDRSTLDILIDSFSRTLQVAETQALVAQKRSRGLPVTTYEFNSRLRLHSELVNPGAVVGEFRELLRSKVRPDHSSFALLLQAYAALGDGPGALGALAAMPRYHVAPCPQSYANVAQAIGPLAVADCRVPAGAALPLAAAYAQAGDCESALGAADAVPCGAAVDPAALNRIISVFAAASPAIGPQATVEAWRRLERRSQVTPDAHTFGLVVRAVRLWERSDSASTLASTLDEQRSRVQALLSATLAELKRAGIAVSSSDATLGELRQALDSEPQLSLGRVHRRSRSDVGPFSDGSPEVSYLQCREV